MYVELNDTENERIREIREGNRKESRYTRHQMNAREVHDYLDSWVQEAADAILPILDEFEWDEDADKYLDWFHDHDRPCPDGCCQTHRIIHARNRGGNWIRFIAEVRVREFERGYPRKVFYMEGNMAWGHRERDDLVAALEGLGTLLSDGEYPDEEARQSAIEAHKTTIRNVIDVSLRRTRYFEGGRADKIAEYLDGATEVLEGEGWEIVERGNDVMVAEWSDTGAKGGKHGIVVEPTVTYNQKALGNYYMDASEEALEAITSIDLHVHGINPFEYDTRDDFCHGDWGRYADAIIDKQGVAGVADAAILCRFAVAQLEGVQFQDPTYAEREAERLKEYRELEARRRQRREEELERIRQIAQRRHQEQIDDLMDSLGIEDREEAERIQSILYESARASENAGGGYVDLHPNDDRLPF